MLFRIGKTDKRYRGAYRYLRLLISFAPLTLAAHGAQVVKEVFKKKEIHCTTRYHLTGLYPLSATRCYRGGKSGEGYEEEIIVRPLVLADAAALHRVVCDNEQHLMPFSPTTVGDFGQRVAVAARAIGEGLKLVHRGGHPNNVQCVILFRARRGAPLQLVGMVSLHSHAVFSGEEPSIEMAYWLTEEMQGRGIGYTAVKLLFLHASWYSPIKRFNIAVLVENRRSRRLALRLGMQRARISDYSTWPYRDEDKKKFEVYTRLAHGFKKKEKGWLAKFASWLMGLVG